MFLRFLLTILIIDNQTITTSFKDHKVRVNDLLGVIPESLISHLSVTTSVDHYTKVLHGRKMFYLLLYGILENDRLNQRTLEDTFNDSVFKILFGLDNQEKIRHSSLSERLSRVSPDYFRQIYDCVYSQFSQCYSCAEMERYSLVRVDSSIVSDTSGRSSQVPRHGNATCGGGQAVWNGLVPRV